MALGVTLESADDAKDQKKASSFLPTCLRPRWPSRAKLGVVRVGAGEGGD